MPLALFRAGSCWKLRSNMERPCGHFLYTVIIVFRIQSDIPMIGRRDIRIVWPRPHQKRWRKSSPNRSWDLSASHAISNTYSKTSKHHNQITIPVPSFSSWVSLHPRNCYLREIMLMMVMMMIMIMMIMMCSCCCSCSCSGSGSWYCYCPCYCSFSSSCVCSCSCSCSCCWLFVVFYCLMFVVWCCLLFVVDCWLLVVIVVVVLVVVVVVVAVAVVILIWATAKI